MSETIEIRVPDIGDFDVVDVVEVLVSEGDTVKTDDSLITLESDKASMEVPSTHDGVVKAVHVAVGDQVGEAAHIVTLEAQASDAPPEPEPPAESEPEATPEPEAPAPAPAPTPAAPPSEPARPSPTASIPSAASSQSVHASPSVRRFARELGADLTQVQGTGRKGRIVKEDVQAWIKSKLQGGGTAAPEGGMGIPPIPAVDFSKFGAIEEKPLHRIRQASARNIHRSWLNIPHVTQFDEADITEMDAFRKASKADAEAAGTKMTPLVFLIKAVVAALKEYPKFNTSLTPDGQFHLTNALDLSLGTL